MQSRLISSAAAFAVLLAACSGTERAEVRILPSSYEIAAVKSELATPAVDEVIRLRPRSVHIQACTATPPAKVRQFREELVARAKVEVTLSFLKATECPS
jgi:hypothetical protein